MTQNELKAELGKLEQSQKNRFLSDIKFGKDSE